MIRFVRLAACHATLALTIVGHAGAQVAQAPKYVQRLELPSRTDGFRRPAAVVADLHAGEVFVCGTWNNRIVIYDQLGSFRYQIQGGTVFRSPIDLAVDPDGYIFVLAWREGERSIVRLDFDGLFIEEIPVPTDEVADVPPEPVSISISPAGDRLYLLDRSAHRLWITGRDGEVVGSADLSGESTDEELQERVYGHVDAYGDRVLVANATLGRILLFDLEGNPQGHVGRKGTATCQSAFPTGGAMNRDGEVFILDKQRMLFTLWRAEDNQCLGEFSGIGRSPGALYAPDDIALDGRGRIYISQTFEGRVQVFDDATPAAVPEPAVARADGPLGPDDAADAAPTDATPSR